MRRRQFLRITGGAVAAWPLHALAQLMRGGVEAQQGMLPIVGCLAAPAEATYTHNVAAVRQGLKEAGLIEGQNVGLEFRWAEGQYDRLPSLAVDLVRRRVTSS